MKIKIIKPNKSFDLIGYFWHIRAQSYGEPIDLKDRTTIDQIGCSFDEVEKLFKLHQHGQNFCMILLYITDGEKTLLFDVQKKREGMFFEAIKGQFIEACLHEPIWFGRSCNNKFYHPDPGSHTSMV